MRHALTPIGEGPLDKGVIEGDGVTTVERESKDTIPLSPILDGVAIPGGIGSVIIEAKNRSRRLSLKRERRKKRDRTRRKRTEGSLFTARVYLRKEK